MTPRESPLDRQRRLQGAPYPSSHLSPPPLDFRPRDRLATPVDAAATVDGGPREPDMTAFTTADRPPLQPNPVVKRMAPTPRQYTDERPGSAPDPRPEPACAARL